MDVIDIIKGVSLDYLKDTPVYDEIKKCMEKVEAAQEVLCAATSGTEDSSMTMLRVGSILSLAIFGNMLNSGKAPKEFSQNDWANIAEKVAKYGIVMEGQKYTEFVFELYAGYIDISIEINKNILSDKAKAEISGLAETLRSYTKSLESGGMKEPDYVDRCLWTSFEAMVKLLAAYKTSFLSKEYSELIQAICDLAVQYGRMSLYSKEQALLAEYLEHQYELDQELSDKYNAYISELNERSEQFNKLIDNAFDPDFRSMLRSSVDLARAAGVDEDQILDSMDKIDDYFG